MWEHLKRGSSPIDWCEGNYQVSANIAEFVNTVSKMQVLFTYSSYQLNFEPNKIFALFS